VFVGLAAEPEMQGGIVLPEGSPVLHLPAFNRFGSVWVRLLWGQVVLPGPASDTGAIGFEVAAPKHFTGGGVIGAGWVGTQQLAQQLRDFGRPKWVVSTSGQARYPVFGLASSTVMQVTGVEAVKMTA